MSSKFLCWFCDRMLTARKRRRRYQGGVKTRRPGPYCSGQCRNADQVVDTLAGPTLFYMGDGLHAGLCIDANCRGCAWTSP